MINPSDPFRFEDRTGHYGTAQADLAPVSPTAALPRLEASERPVDPMGASPEDDGERILAREDHDARKADGGEIAVATYPTAGSEAGVQTSTAFATADPVTPTSAMAMAMQINGSAAVSHGTGDGEDARTPTFQTTGANRVEAAVTAPADPTAPQGSGTPVTLLTPTLAPATTDASTTEANFATIATQMNQMLADMAARIEGLSPGNAGRADGVDDVPTASPTDVFGDAQDRLDALFNGLRGNPDETDAGSLSGATGGGRELPSDLFADGRTRTEDLLADIGPGLSAGRPSDAAPDPLEGALDRLDALVARPEGTARDPVDAEASTSPSLLARLFEDGGSPAGSLFEDGDDGEPMEGAGLLAFASPSFDPGRWDDLPDFG